MTRLPGGLRAALLTLSILLLGAADAAAQQADRGWPIKKPGTAPTGERRALIVGISRYLNLPAENQLHYAAADARLFAAFLTSPAGGGLDTNRLRLLVDSNATGSNIYAGLAWLALTSKPGDEAIIYFAGHGDVDTVTTIAPGFLLATDVYPGRPYNGGGTVRLRDLAEYVATILKAQARVLVVTDACRAGKVVGTEAGAARTTADMLEHWEGAAKLVSSGPDQRSREGPQWGGGHGVFTFYLIEGLSGAADADSDQVVDLKEAYDYAYARVRSATAREQTPLEDGAPDRPVAWVRAAAADDHPGDTAAAAVVLDPSVARGLEEFRTALAANAILEPEGASAWSAYERLLALPAAAPQLPELRIALAGALQQDAQRVMDDYLAGGNTQPTAARLRRAATALSRALELAGKTSVVMGPMLRARRNFLSGYALVQKGDYAAALDPLRQAIALEPTAAYAYNALGLAFLELGRLDSARAAFDSAHARAPRWSYPYLGLGRVEARQGRAAEAEGRFREAAAVDPSFADPHEELAELFKKSNRPDSAERELRTSLQSDSLNPRRWIALGLLYQEQRRYGEATRAYERAVQVDTACERCALIYADLGDVAYAQQRPSDAERNYRRAVALDSTEAQWWQNLAQFYVNEQRYREALPMVRRVVALRPQSGRWVASLGYVEEQLGDTVGAEREYRGATTLDPLSVERHLTLARFLFRRSRLPAAEAAYRQALDIDSTNAPAQAELGRVYWEQGKIAEATAVWRVAARRTPVDRETLNNLAWALYGRGMLQEAAQWSDRSLAAADAPREDRRDYFDTRANIALDAGDPRRALALFDSATAPPPAAPDGPVLFGRAMALLELRRPREAAETFQRALDADSQIAEDAYVRDLLRYSAKAVARLARLRALRGPP